MKEVFEVCEKVTKKNIAVKQMPKREGDPAVLVADNSKAKSILGWDPQKTLEYSIKTAFNYEQKNR